MNTPTYWLQLYKEHSRNRKLPAATQTACFNIVLFDRIKCTRLNTKELRSCLLTHPNHNRKNDRKSNQTLTLTLTKTQNINPKHNPNLTYRAGDLQTVYANLQTVYANYHY